MHIFPKLYIEKKIIGVLNKIFNCIFKGLIKLICIYSETGVFFTNKGFNEWQLFQKDLSNF